MPRAKTWCALKPGHSKRFHRSKAGVEHDRAYAREHNRHGYVTRMNNEEGRAAERTYAADKYQRRSRMLAAVKLTAGCADCGYDKHPAALEFDHLPGTDKYCAVSKLVMRSLSILFEEIEKCEVVCACCHRIRTTERDQWKHPWKYGTPF